MRKIIKKGIIISLGLGLFFGIVSCNKLEENPKENISSNTSTNSYYPVTITTYNYKKEPIEITFEKAPESVLAIYQNSIETMLSLGLEDKIKLGSGLDHDIKEEYKIVFDKIDYSDDFKLDKETTIEQNLDFILSWYSLFNENRLGDIDYWHKKGINTYMSLNSGPKEYRTVENEITDILNLGKIFNVEEKAKFIVNEINQGIDEVVSKVNNQEKQSALIIEYVGEHIYTYGEKTLGADMIYRLGGELLNKDGKNITEEDLIELNPDCIFVVYMDKGNLNSSQEEVNKILNKPKFSNLDAVKNGRVNPIALGEMYCSGIRTIDGINTFVKGLYPNLK